LTPQTLLYLMGEKEDAAPKSWASYGTAKAVARLLNITPVELLGQPFTFGSKRKSELRSKR
jgi:hypothetical protein